jgi:hypothetical protein
LRKRPDQSEPKIELAKDKKTESSIPRSPNNSVNKDFLPVSAPDPANPAELMVISWKEKNLNSTPRRSSPERNDDLS